MFTDALSIFKTPSPHYKLDDRAMSNLPAVECMIAVAAIDHEDPMPRDVVVCQNALWDTGAYMPCRTSPKTGCLQTSDDSSTTMTYMDLPGATKARVFRCRVMVEVSNKTIIQIYTVVMVIPRTSAPNGRSGVLLGQTGVIDSVEYQSVPQKLTSKSDPNFAQDGWGYFNISCYCDGDGGLRYVDRKLLSN